MLKGYSFLVKPVKDPVMENSENRYEGHFQRNKNTYIVAGVALLVFIALHSKSQQPIYVFIMDKGV
jgi:hypothetical protein